MACPSSGEIKISDLVAEFGGSAPHGLTEYYRNGGEVPGNNTNVPTSGQISLTQFYSAVNEIQQTYSATTTNLNLATVFGNNWGSTVPKRVIINSGVTIGATSGNYAINIPSGMAGTLVIDNNGSIEGHGGAANGGTGGNAIHATSTTGVTINNNSGASIKAGGGGGGQGGTGGTGGNGGTGGTGGGGIYTSSTNYGSRGSTTSSAGWAHGLSYTLCGTLGRGFCKIKIDGYSGSCNLSGTPNGRVWEAHGYASGYESGMPVSHYVANCVKYGRPHTNGGSGGAGGSSGGAGGAGGAGGVGQGYNQSAGSGSGGSAGSPGGGGSGGSSGGTNAGSGGTGGARGQGGTGGTGGNGGSFGNSGSNGATGNTGATGATGNSGANGNRTNGSGGSGGSSGSGGSGGSSGGLAGYYIYNRSSITLNNSGTVAGR